VGGVHSSWNVLADIVCSFVDIDVLVEEVMWKVMGFERGFCVNQSVLVRNEIFLLELQMNGMR
jgi:hypothetical protein